MDKYVVDRETAEKLKDYLPEGFESEHLWFKWPFEKYRIRRKSPDANKTVITLKGYKEYPAPILDEVLELLPKFLTVKSSKRSGNEVVWPTVMKGGRNGKGTIGLMSFGENTYSWHKRIQVEINKATAAALLYMWLVDEGLHKTGGR